MLSTEAKSVRGHLQHLSFNWDMALKIKVGYKVTDYSFNCDMILLFPETAMADIKTVIDRILDEY